MKLQNWVLVGVGVFGLSGLANGEDWPQWRGPQRNGISQETGLLRQWPKEGPKLLWQVADIGSAYSTPAVAGERIYLLTSRGKYTEFAVALNAIDGAQIWARQLGKASQKGPPYPGARSTPTVDGDVLYALGSDGELACLETGTGKPRWQKNLRSDFAGKPGFWAYAESVLVDGDVLVCTPGGAKATLVALNKNTGDLIWQSAVPGGDEAGYASAIVVEVGGIKQYVQFLQKGVVGVDAKTGKFLWRYEQSAKGSMANIPTPVAQGNFIYSGSGEGGGGLFKLNARQSAIEVEPVYFSKKNLPNSMGGTVSPGNYLYGTNARGLLCVELATGKVMWQEKGIGPGSICYADGCLYLHDEKGDLALIEATPGGYKQNGRFNPPGQTARPERGASLAWSYPVISNGRLYLRDLGVLWCYDIKQGE
jgi:outer membrane protein assembly factor BamB